MRHLHNITRRHPLKKCRLLFFVATLLAMQAFTPNAVGQTHTLRGTITDRATGETLIGATVLDQRSGRGTVTNAYGRFSLTLPADSIHLRISYVGYSVHLERLYLSSDYELNYAMSPNQNLKEVVVTGDKPTGHKSVQMSAIEIPMEQIKSVPVLFGEADILKAVQLLPGVQSGSEGTSGIYVRGGGPDENLFLIDGVPLYNVNHLGGFFSAFNSDAIKNVTLYKGSFPAHYGGRLSSVLDVTSNNGNDKKVHGTGSIGLIAAKVNVEGPIVKEKTTFNLSLRRTYLDALIQPIIMAVSSTEGVAANAGYYFYDLNAKITHKFSDRSRLFATFYSGDDVVYIKVRDRYSDNGNQEWMKMKYNWGNMVGALRWNYELNPRLFMNLSASYTRYRNDIGLGYESTFNNIYEELNMTYKSGIRDITARADFDLDYNQQHAVKFGGAAVYHIFTPEVQKLNFDFGADDRLDTTVGQSTIHAADISLYAEDDWTINDAFKLSYGANLGGFIVQNTFYPSIQPRLSGRMMLTDDLSLKAGYAYMNQYMHLLSNSSISLPTDLWVPVTERIAPMKAHQVAAGLFYNFKQTIDFSIEGYYKYMDNLLEYRDGASFWGNSTGWEDKVLMGCGWAYGVEFLAQKQFGNLTGWVGYTLSKTMRKFDREGQTINDGKPFPAKYDRRHDISIVLSYKPSDHFDVSATWVFSSGNTATLATQYVETPAVQSYYDYWGFDETEGSSSTKETPYFEHRNNFRMPSYHRMDIGLNFHKQKKHGVRTWNISVYNVYNRKNPYIVYTRTVSGLSGSRMALMQLSLFPIIPSVSYTFKF
ncbi:MAG: TonB-dependent receptor [Bacteroidales bacterium]|nr:TonB-dependent receptor [Bacteroidales bacterium]